MEITHIEVGGMIERLQDYDWQEAFDVAARDGIEVIGGKFERYKPMREDVAEILHLDDGENDERSWIGVFRLNNGHYLYVTAWCDYTGWG